MIIFNKGDKMDSNIFITLLKDAGLDTDKAIQRFMGNSDLFIKFILKFPECMNFNAMLNALEQENEEEFYMLVHNLKGNAGNLGINNVYECAQAILTEFRSTKFVQKKKLQSIIEEARTEGDLIVELLQKYES